MNPTKKNVPARVIVNQPAPVTQQSDQSAFRLQQETITAASVAATAALAATHPFLKVCFC